jgi:hypothetical protein
MQLYIFFKIICGILALLTLNSSSLKIYIAEYGIPNLRLILGHRKMLTIALNVNNSDIAERNITLYLRFCFTAVSLENREHRQCFPKSFCCFLLSFMDGSYCSSSASCDYGKWCSSLMFLFVSQSLILFCRW